MLINPKKRRAHRWLSQSSVQFDPELRFHLGGHNYGGDVGKTSSYDPTENRVLWAGQLQTTADRRALYHEAAHGLDLRYMTDADRARVRRLIDPTGRYAHLPWMWSQMPAGQQNPGVTYAEPMMERFADAVADVAMTRHGYPALRAFLAEIQARGPHS